MSKKKSGLDDDLRTGLVFYGRDRSSGVTMYFNRSVVDRLEMYLFFLWTGRFLRPVGPDRLCTVASYVKLYIHTRILRTA